MSVNGFYRHNPSSPHVKRELQGLRGKERKAKELFLAISGLLIGPTSGANARHYAESLLSPGPDALIRELEHIVREYKKG